MGYFHNRLSDVSIQCLDHVLIATSGKCLTWFIGGCVSFSIDFSFSTRTWQIRCKDCVSASRAVLSSRAASSARSKVSILASNSELSTQSSVADVISTVWSLRCSGVLLPAILSSALTMRVYMDVREDRKRQSTRTSVWIGFHFMLTVSVPSICRHKSVMHATSARKIQVMDGS